MHTITPPISITLLALALSSILQATTPPNIIYILADDMGCGDVAAYNPNSKIPTPHIDSLADQGLVFTDAHTNSSVCTPTRYGILTGRYCWRTMKKSGVLQGYNDHLIATDRETVPSLLKKQGYATACIGKWHLGMDWPTTDDQHATKTDGRNIDFNKPIQNGPNALGFDYYFGISASLNHSPHAYIENQQLLGTTSYIGNKAGLKARNIQGKEGLVADNYEQDQVLKDLAAKTDEWIAEQQTSNPEQPFFIYLPLPSPHAPLVPSKDFAGSQELGIYADFCVETDWVVGQVLASLEKHGIADNTLVIFTADNGTSPQAKLEHLHANGHDHSNGLRGLKGSLYEAGHRVPFIVRWPDAVKADQQTDAFICTTDLIATTAEITGAELAANAGEDSVSFLPALQGNAIPGNKDRGIVHHSDSGQFSIRRGDWKLILAPEGGSRRQDPMDALVINAGKLELFNMATDTAETTNVATQHPETVDALSTLLAEQVVNGRSTPGPKQENEYDKRWTQLQPIADYLPADFPIK